jgi:uncharacterized membrane protein YhaH (DUF805 family)
LHVVGTVVLVLLSLFISDDDLKQWGDAAVSWLVVNVPFLVYFIQLTILRLQDTNRNGTQAILLFVPFINLFYAIIPFFAPGTEGENKYGAPSDQKVYKWFLRSVLSDVSIKKKAAHESEA